MGFGTFISHKVNGSDLKAGDHVYTWRWGFAYAHHGIYVGEGRVVSFNSQLKCIGVNKHQTCESSLSSSASLPDCGFKKSESGGVIVHCLNCFMKYGSLYRYKYGARKRVCLGKIRGGTCTTAEPDEPEAVIHRAMYLLHNNGFGEYNFLGKNCEDFALYCKTGLLVSPKHKTAALGCSGQVRYAFGAVDPVSRYYSDIGVRKDVHKVQVEDLATFHANY